MSNKKFKIAVKESKKSEAAESEFIQDFRAYMDTMDGEPYSEDDLIGWGWKWVDEEEEYPNGTKTCATTYTMTDNGARYKLVVHWNSFMETIVGYELTQESANEPKKSEGLPPKRLGSKRQYRSRADLINKMKQLGAVEITTSKQFNDIKNSQWLHTAGYALDTNGNLVAQSYYGDKDGKWYYTSTRNFDSDYLPESKQHENRTKEEEVTNIFKGMKEWATRWSNSDKDRKTIADNLDLEAVQENMSDIVEILDNNFEWDARVFKSVGEVLDALKQVDGKKSEAMDMSRAKQIVMGDTRHNPKTVAEEIAWSAWVESDGHPKALLRKAARDYYNSGLLASAERARYLLDTYTDEMRELYKEFTSSVEPAEVASTGEVIPWSSFEDMSSKNEADAEAFIQWITENVARKLVRYASESMKSESLSLKQKELKDMARYGEAEDITTISDAEAKELRKKGIELVGVSRGTYGMNGALLRDKDGNKYVITARSSNLFYFV